MAKTKTTVVTTTTTTTTKVVGGKQHDYILIDRSGSMGGTPWIEALNSVNGYVRQLAKDEVDTKITVAFFDQNGIGCSFEVKRANVTTKEWRDLSNDDGTPRGGTPLNDATGKLLDLAEVDGGDNVAITIMTDGMENASQEYTVAKIKARLDQVRARGWVVSFLGANFDNAQQAAGYGTAANNTVQSSIRNLGDTMSAMASKRAVYSTTGQSATMDFSEEEKQQLKK